MKTLTRYAAVFVIAILVTLTVFVPLINWSLPWLLKTSQIFGQYLYHFATLFAFGLLVVHTQSIKPSLLFAYNCFLKPFIRKSRGSSSSEHQHLLESFYEGQADIYDVTRRKLLRGRTTMLRLCAAQLKQVYFDSGDDEQNSGQIGSRNAIINRYDRVPSPPSSPFLRPVDPMIKKKKIVWIDVGGGTGWNIEQMNSFIPIDKFHKIYLVDITPSLCDIAETRFAALGWTNVQVLCMDALKFELPSDPNVEIGLITFSYSLSMIPNFYPIVDKISSLLSKNGIVGVADFFTSAKYSPLDPIRQHSYFFRWFWQIWFDLDNVYLHHSRRDYLEHKFVTVKHMNGLNRFIGPVVKIPYYIWIGAQPLIIGESSAPIQVPQEMEPLSLDITTKKVAVPVSDVKKSVSSSLNLKHIHGASTRWRQAFDVKLVNNFNTYIYAFAWEDPRVDLQYLELNENDQMLVLTSGGCNALEYAIQGPKRIHCVDMNPYQGHLMELKLAAITSLPYQDFWRLFGEGHHPAFSRLLDTYLSPYLSSMAYEFWKYNCDFQNIYETGCSGAAIRVFRFLVHLVGLDGSVERLCASRNLEDQYRIWTEEVRPHFLNRKWIGLLSNYKFAWEFLGVPKRQFEMLLKEGSVYDYIADTLDPLVRKHLLSDDSYFYHLCLRKKYIGNDQNQCPSYLTQKGFEKLKTSKNLNAIKIHTAPIVKVLENQIEPETLTKVLLMDHFDWFDGEQAHDEILALSKAVRKDGKVFWRSASKKPWYSAIFVKYGFEVKPVAVRMSEKDRSDYRWKKAFENDQDAHYEECIDRVNMYASFWVAIKQ